MRCFHARDDSYASGCSDDSFVCSRFLCLSAFEMSSNMCFAYVNGVLVFCGGQRLRRERRLGWTLWLAVYLAMTPLVFADNLALLSGTLRTYQRAGCDDEVVTLKCPHGTSISVELAQYGKSGPTHTLCPRQPGVVPAVVASGPSIDASDHEFNVTCLWPNALQYSLLQTVVEACQKKRQCKFQTSPRTFGGDPCPGVRKYVEVAYKCRPYEFRSKVACEDDSVTLKCNPNARIAVYSASFGRTEYESIQCPQPQGVPEETCLVSYATEAVMRRCHGKRRCHLTAGAEMFGNPCRPQSRMYLKVVYTCVPRTVLREHLVEHTGDDEVELPDDEDEDFDIDDAAAFSPSPNVEGGPGARTGGAGSPVDDRPSAPRTTPSVSGAAAGAPPIAKASGGGSSDLGKFGGKFGPYTTPYHNFNNLFVPSSHPTGPTTIKDMLGDDVSDEKILESNVNCTTVTTSENTEVIGFISEWINAYNFITQNKEKFYLYLILSITAGLLLFLGLVIGRLLVQRHRTKRNTKFHQPVPEQTLPNGFADDISEVEADIDLTTPVPMVAVHSPPASVAEVVRFNTGTLRRAPGEPDSTAPRSLNRSGNSQYYYG